LRCNDAIISDQLDYYFYTEGEEYLDLTIIRDNKELKFTIENPGFEELGIVPEPLKVKRCRNKCIFCFVDQQPPGMRKSLYIKDEDIRYSFLEGNYVTLSDLSAKDLQRIIEQRFSPLYVSVHSTDEQVRHSLLGRNNSKPIMPILEKLTSSGIRIHTQIVVVPGYNDGRILEKTVGELYELGENCQSCAIVPVGLTKYRQTLTYLENVSQKLAREIIDFSIEFRSRIDRPEFLQCADELFLLADYDIPDEGYYGDFPQLDNGVGMYRLFINDAIEYSRKPICERPNGSDWIKVGIVAGERASKLFRNYLPENLGLENVEREIIEVKNDFWGELVTSSNLLTGGDINKYISSKTLDMIFLPPRVVNKDERFLDNMSLEQLKSSTQSKIVIGPAYLSDIQEVISNYS